jgi:hypothetical protein
MCDPKSSERPQTVADEALDQAVGGSISLATQSAMQKQQESVESKSTLTKTQNDLLTSMIGGVR